LCKEEKKKKALGSTLALGNEWKNDDVDEKA
jgi:hypothetical protein